MVIQYLFIFVAFLIDGVISVCFPPTFIFNTMSFVSCFGFIALVLTIRKMEYVDAIILSLLSGMFYDFFYTDTFLVYTILFPVLCLLVKSWTKHLGDSLIENIVISICAVFALELFIFLYMHVFGLTALSFMTWIRNRMFLTIVVNVGLVFIQFFLIKIRDEFIRSRETKVRREEKIFMFKSKR